MASGVRWCECVITLISRSPLISTFCFLSRTLTPRGPPSSPLQLSQAPEARPHPLGQPSF